MSIKEQLYYLIREYRKGNYTTPIFCEQFTVLYCNKRHEAELSKKENEIFGILNEVTSRYSEFEDDLRKYPGVYKNDQDVKNAVESIYNNLKEYASGLL